MAFAMKRGSQVQLMFFNFWRKNHLQSLPSCHLTPSKIPIEKRVGPWVIFTRTNILEHWFFSLSAFPRIVILISLSFVWSWRFLLSVLHWIIPAQMDWVFNGQGRLPQAATDISRLVFRLRFRTRKKCWQIAGTYAVRSQYWSVLVKLNFLKIRWFLVIHVQIQNLNPLIWFFLFFFVFRLGFITFYVKRMIWMG